MDDIKRAEQRGYSKGYQAGKRLADRSNVKVNERFDKFLCAAITGLLGGVGPWQRGGVADSSPKDYAETAAQVARELMRKSQ